MAGEDEKRHADHEISTNVFRDVVGGMLVVREHRPAVAAAVSAMSGSCDSSID